LIVLIILSADRKKRLRYQGKRTLSSTVVAKLKAIPLILLRRKEGSLSVKGIAEFIAAKLG
jgi:hypothetical protein